MKKCTLALCLLFGSIALADEPNLAILPVGSEPAALETPHFPSRLCAFVWRNWNLVEVERLAQTLETSPENVTRLATALGLPNYNAPTWDKGQIYITVLRRNWHILPYDQILTLLQMSAETLEFNLREDDFLFIKLGILKPKCERLVYVEPTQAEWDEISQWRRNMESQMGAPLTTQGEEPRFAFIAGLKHFDPDLQPREKAPSRFETRYVFSYFAIFGDPLLDDNAELYPDGLLQKLANSGVNGVWLHVVLRDLAPSATFPEFGVGHEKRLANLRKLVERAKKFNISVFLYMNEPRAMPIEFFQKPGREEMCGAAGRDFCMCTSNPQVRAWIEDSLAFVFREAPDLGGIFAITASENQTNCASHANQKTCPRCSKRTDAEILSEVIATMERGVHRSSPNAKVLAWDWGWRGHQDGTEIIKQLPKNVYLMTVSEWALPLNRGGIPTSVGEYSISAVGPGPRAQLHWKTARECGLKTAAKVQLGTTWEIAAVPYVPAMELVAEHCSNLAQTGVDVLMMSWSLGGYPSPNLRLPLYFDRNPIPTVDEALNEMAVERFSEQGAPLARKGWKQISDAYREFPYGGSVIYTAPTQMGPANLLYLAPTQYHATMVGIPYDDLNAWRSMFPPEVFIAQFRKMSAGFLAGAATLNEATTFAPVQNRISCAQDARYAQCVGLHFASVANQAEFILLRDRLATAQSDGSLPCVRNRIRLRMHEILRDEIDLARQEYALTRTDSTIGFESTNHYWFVPGDLVEKVMNCRYILTQLPLEKEGEE